MRFAKYIIRTKHMDFVRAAVQNASIYLASILVYVSTHLILRGNVT